jgi:hypothetical protein
VALTLALPELAKTVELRATERVADVGAQPPDSLASSTTFHRLFNCQPITRSSRTKRLTLAYLAVNRGPPRDPGKWPSPEAGQFSRCSRGRSSSVIVPIAPHYNLLGFGIARRRYSEVFPAVIYGSISPWNF